MVTDSFSRAERSPDADFSSPAALPLDRARQLLRDSAGLYLSEPDRACDIARDIVSIAEAEGDPALMAQARMEWGRALRQKADLRGARQQFEAARDLYEAAGDSENFPRALQALGTVFSAAGDLNGASELFTKALPLARERHDEFTIQRVLNSWGIVHIRSGDYSNALRTFEECLDSLSRSPDPYLESSVLLNVGAIFQRAGQYTIAIEHFEQSLGLGRKLEDRRHIASCLIFLGDTATTEKRSGEARRYLEEALQISEQERFKDLHAHALMSLAEAALAIGEPDRALIYLLRSRPLLHEPEDAIPIQKVEQALGEAYLKLGQIPDAEAPVANALRLARQIASPQLLYEANLLASELAAKRLEYKVANEYLHEALRQHEILFSEANQRAVGEMELRMAIEARKQ